MTDNYKEQHITVLENEKVRPKLPLQEFDVLAPLCANLPANEALWDGEL